VVVCNLSGGPQDGLELELPGPLPELEVSERGPIHMPEVAYELQGCSTRMTRGRRPFLVHGYRLWRLGNFAPLLYVYVGARVVG
jgi:hypothetical protein